jgi:hypothetical protein
METPLLERIKRQVLMAKSQREEFCLLAEKGIYLTRTGDHESATEISARIRSTLAARDDPEIYIWLTLLEGLIGFYSSGTTREKSRILRAYAVAKSISRFDLQQYAAAWMAHQYFNSGNYGEMSDWLLRSGLSKSINPSAKIRACLTAADAWQCVGENEVAASWYSIARTTAAEIGDRASIMASIENRAAMKLDGIWLKSIEQIVEEQEISEIESELLGGLGYEKFTRSESLLYQAPIWRYRLESLKGNYVQALDLLLRSRANSCGVDTSLAWSHDSDVAWVCHKIGLMHDAKFQFELALQTPADRLDNDDAAVYWKRMSTLDAEFFGGSRSAEFDSRSRESMCAFNDKLNILKESIKDIRR